MPTPALLLLLATLLPLLSFLILLFLGKRLGAPLAGYVATLFIGAAFVCSILAMITWYSSSPDKDWGFEKAPINLPVRWLPIGTTDHPNGLAQYNPGYLNLGIFIDSLTIVMFSTVTLVSTLVHIFSIGSMREDKQFSRFFTHLSLFCFSMLGFVLGGTLLHLFIFWELLALCSYLLIGFAHEKKSATNAAIKAFLINRIGDFAFLIGFGILFYHLGNTDFRGIWTVLGAAGAGAPITLAGGVTLSTTLLTIMGIALFCGVIAKSAQFPLHVWLPDATQAPAPALALINAATILAAGVYLLARLFPIFTPNAKLFIAIIGVITLTLSAFIAIVQTDIKKILAYSTMSQLGYMILAMGVGSWIGALFHLITHAFFQSLLFLAAGSVVLAAGHEQQIPRLGGLIRKIPVTAITFLIAVLAISAVGFGPVGFSGYYSKNMILTHAGSFAALAHALGKSRACYLFFALPTLVAYITPFYMMRCWMLTFWGKPRLHPSPTAPAQKAPDLLSQTRPQIKSSPQEVPSMWGPLVVLSVLTMIAGSYMNVQEMIEASLTENNAYARFIDPNFKGFDTVWPGAVPEQRATEPRDPAELPLAPPRAARRATSDAELTLSQSAHVRGHEMVRTYLNIFGFTAGILFAILIYARGPDVADALLQITPLRWLRNWLYHGMYFDALYSTLFVGITLGFSKLLAAFDSIIIDGIANALAGLIRRPPQRDQRLAK